MSEEWLVVGEDGSEPSGRVPKRDAGIREKVRLLFVRLIQAMINKKKWAVRGHMLSYAKKMPKTVDGPASGFGKHIGWV